MADTSTSSGRIFVVDTAGADIIGFDPAKDKLNLGDNSVHNFIVVDTPTGVGFMNPWSGETLIVQGVSLAQLTIDSFVPIVNDHLRQTLSGALAWEHGIVPAPHTVYARSHELGQIDKVAFDPATDVVDFRYFGTREQIYMSDSSEGVIISNSGTGQALILLGVTKAQLTVNNFVFYSAEVREDRVHLQLGFTTVPDSQVIPQGVEIAGTNTWPIAAGSGEAPSGITGTTYKIEWHYDSNTTLAFNPAVDKLDFGWFKAYEFDISEVNGSTVISITNNHQTYTLTGVKIGALAINNIIALDTSARAEWQSTIDAAPKPVAPPVINLSDAQVVEGDAGTAQMLFTVSLSHAADGPVSVSYSTLNGTATAGTDYTSAVGTVTFAAGETQKTIAVAVTGDTLHELNEAFSLQLSAPSGATINDGSAVGTIIDNDPDPTPGVPPKISIADISVVEGNTDMAHFRFQVTLDKASTETITVHYASSDLTATGGTDYEILDGTLTFAPGETTQTIHAHMYSDTVVEPDETYKVTLSNPTNATIADGTAIATIVNDDLAAPLPTIAIADAAISEGNSGSKLLSFVVSLSAASTSAVSVSYATGDGTATAGSDYTAGTGTVTFAPGETSKTIQVAVRGDTVVEANETFTVTLSAPSGATIADGSAIGTITNDDVAVVVPTVSIADASVVEGNSGTTALSFVVSLSAASTSAVSVSYATANGTATAGSDYTAKTGTVTFAPGETSKTVQVAVTGDTAVEANETFTVALSSPSGATLGHGTATATITNDDVASTPGGGAVVDYSVTSNWGAGFTAAMTVEAGASALSGWTVEFDAGFTITNIWNATIVSHVGTHYVLKNMSYNASVGAGKDTAFGFQATAGSGGTAASGFLINGKPSGGGSTPTLPTLSVSDATVIEGNSGTSDLAFTVSLSAASATAVTVAYGTANGTATAGSDFTGASGTLTFAPGETSKVVHVAVTGDRTVEANETLALKLSAPTGATLVRATATGTITNDDAAVVVPTVSVSDASVTEGNSGTKDLVFNVTLSQAATGPVTLRYATADGTATAGSDYGATSGTLTFAAGETSKQVHVQVNGDTLVEGNETLTLTLSSPTGATIADGSGAGLITNDDVAPVVPSVSVADASVTEGASGITDLAFTVSLSKATTAPVSLHYATADGTATAGSDYVAGSGTITFAAGETSKVVHVQVNGDTAVEANETLKLILSQPAGATIATGTATGTIVNDDVTPGGGTPAVSIGDVTVTEGNPAVATATGWFSTSGNQIIDADGNSVQIAGVNWFGFESNTGSPHGLWTRGYKEMMQQMLDEGFNTIRLPFSSDMLHSTGQAGSIDYSKNPDLKGLTSLQVMDKIVQYADEIGIKIILDHHRSSAGDGTSANGLWYDSSHSEASWIADWQMLATRYASDTSVIGADLHNEPYNGTWGDGGANDWARAATAAGNAIGAVNDNWLIFVEGIATYKGQNYWWGGNLMGVRDHPIELNVDNKLVYSAHDYPNSVYAQPWFQGANFAADLPAKFDQMWGFIYKEQIAPVYIGEFGTKLTDPKDVAWFKAITAYLGGDFNNDGVKDISAGEHGPSWTFWSWNPNSSDTGGILQNDWSTVNENKMVYLTPIEAPFPALDGSGGGVPGVHADFQVTLSQAASTAVSVEYHTVAADAASAADFTASSGTVVFQPGETTKVISIAITADKAAEATEHFAVVLSNPVGVSVVKGTGTGTILDNDGTPSSPTTPTTPTTPTHADLHGTLTVVDAWNSGFNANISLHNDGTIPTSGWQVKVEMPNEISSIWNAQILSHDADGYVIGNAAWNGTVGADAEISFGFTATGHLDPTHVGLLF
ncbi:chitinase [Azorhizobium sp. AG788]|uniref:Calx-beta domain-containing protein n=1 Tax=Azorhizobium sp. AG788 TaxID=2183897 RepID=UPI00105B60C8|nr:Calx-beta domain-containing protein [Azorhizobium sp. AG788]TDT88397.1 chitinase [Azorhizobium sp. AG788]